MSDALTLLDEALELGRKELALLADGDVDGVWEASLARSRLLDQAWSERDGVDVDQLLGKLKRLKELQGQMTSDAKRLRDDLRADLARVKQEGKRFSGYASATKVTPLASRFVSKKG
jgi:hypothetical protein